MITRIPLSVLYEDLNRSYVTAVNGVQISADQTISVLVPDSVIEPIWMLSNPDLFEFKVNEKAISLKPKGTLGRCRVMAHSYEGTYLIGNLIIEVVAGPTSSVTFSHRKI